MTDSDVLVQDYLTRLGRAASGLDDDRRHELIAGIEEHIDAARAAGVADDESGLRTLLDRLGEPEVIVAAAQEREDGRPPVRPAEQLVRRRGTGLELAAVLMITAGSLLPVVGWLVGVVLLWCSDRWRVGEKLLGTLVLPLGPGGLLVFGALAPFRTGEVCSSSGTVADPAQPGLAPAVEVVSCTGGGPPAWAAQLLLVVLLLAAVAVPVWLYRTARRRADAEAAAALGH